MTIYKKRARSLTLKEMIAVRKWLRLCYRQTKDKAEQDELVRLGVQLNVCIEVASSTDCEIAEW